MTRAARLPLLGPLERLVLEELWRAGTRDVAQVHACISLRRDVARNTVQTTLERLVRKRLATRARRGRAYVYEAALTRREWIARALDDLVASLPRVESQLLAASFVDLADRTSPELLDALAERVRARERERERTRVEAPSRAGGPHESASSAADRPRDARAPERLRGADGAESE